MKVGQSQRTYSAVSSSNWQPLQIGLVFRRSLKRCVLKWQCRANHSLSIRTELLLWIKAITFTWSPVYIVLREGFNTSSSNIWLQRSDVKRDGIKFINAPCHTSTPDIYYSSGNKVLFYVLNIIVFFHFHKTTSVLGGKMQLLVRKNYILPIFISSAADCSGVSAIFFAGLLPW